MPCVHNFSYSSFVIELQWREESNFIPWEIQNWPGVTEFQQRCSQRVDPRFVCLTHEWHRVIGDKGRQTFFPFPPNAMETSPN